MIEISYLRSIFRRPDGQNHLHQSRITDVEGYADFGAFVAGFLDLATYPSPSAHKMETYGWTPTLFASSLNGRGEAGIWRDGRQANPHLTLFIADLDNQHSQRTMIQLSDVEEALTGLALSHLLYTSFTSKPERPKFRVVIPISRPITPDEAFSVFTWFNAAFDFQLDGSIYDPGDHLYGPPSTSTISHRIDLGALDVEAYLAAAEALPEEARAFVKRNTPADHSRRDPTPEECEQAARLAADLATQAGVSIHNPSIFRPDWLQLCDVLYVADSHSQTAFGLLAKAWLKSGGTLTRGDLQTLHAEIDARMNFYLSRNYPTHERERGITSIMRRPVTPAIETPALPGTTHRERRLARLGL